MEKIPYFFKHHDIIRQAIYTVLILSIAWVAARIIDRVLNGLGAKLSQRVPSRLSNYILQATRRPVVYIVFLLGAYVAFHRLGLRVVYYEYIDNVIFVLALFVGVLLSMRVCAAILSWYQEKIALHTDIHLERDFLPLVDKLIKVLLLLIGIDILLRHFKVDVRSILVTLGVGSLAIGLALQDTLANMFGGFTIMIDRPFRINDHIRLTTGEEGDVISIGMRSTRIKSSDNNMIIIPNSTLVKNTLINYSYPDTSVQIRIKIGVEHGADVNKAKEILHQAVDNVPSILKNPPPVVYFTEFTDYGQNLILQAWIDDHRQRDKTLDHINQRISDGLRAASINVSVPSKRVYISRPPDRQHR